MQVLQIYNINTMKKFSCTVCKEDKPKSEFSGSQIKKKKDAMTCKSCIIDS